MGIDKIDLVILAMMVSTFILGVAATNLYNYYQENKQVSKESYNSNCSQVDVADASSCLRNWIKTFYNYTIRDEKSYNATQGTLEDIKINGGDCFDYTNIYQTELTNLGFKTKKESIFLDGNESGHTFLIAWDKEMKGYCKLDLLNVDCLDFKKGVKNDTI